MKVIQVNTTLKEGGAAIAVFRLNKSLTSIKGLSSIVFSSSYFKGNILYLLYKKFKSLISIQIRYLCSFNSRISPTDFAIMPSIIHKKINFFEADIVNLHWINSEFISIESIKGIKKKLVWTLHDTWPLHGSLHYELEENHNSFFYSKKPNFLFKYLYKLNRKRLENLYKNKKITFVCPSKWMLQKYQNSLVSKYSNAVHIPNPLDLDIFKPLNKKTLRRKFRLPENKKLIFFGAYKADANYTNFRKGYHLLQKVLLGLKNLKNIELVTVGLENNKNSISKFKVHNFGKINSEEEMAKIYSCCDLIIVPSIIDNLPQVATEAVSCGLPAIAFKIGGLSDIIQDNKNGYLIEPFNTSKMAEKTKFLINNEKILKSFSEFSRQYALKNWSYKIISQKYRELYTNIIN